MRPIYLDYNATTPVDPRVLEAMLPYLREHFGNPSSSHPYGVQARMGVEQARRQVATLLGGEPDEIVFTGSGSEANNLAIKGIAGAYRDRGDHVITSQVEHPAVLEPCRYLERPGFRVTYLPVNNHGRVDPDAVVQAINPRTILITIMHANNEVGTIQPIAAIGRVARAHGIPFHTDAAQSVGKIPTRVDELQVDLLTVVGHKFYAPKGVGALYIRRGVQVESLIHGVGHEGGRRASTENVAGVVGLGEAGRLAGENLAETAGRLRELRERLHQGLMQQGVQLALNGCPTERLPNTLNLSFTGIDSNSLLAALPEIAASTGSACHAGETEPSAVLLAMGTPKELALGAVCFSLGCWTTAEEVDQTVTFLVERLRTLSGDRRRG